MPQDQHSYESFHQILEDRARQFEFKPYIESIDQGRAMSFGEMNRCCNRVANFLKRSNIGKPDRITLIGRNCIETLIIFLGVLKYGAVINPINSEESPANIRHIIDRVNPSLVIFDREIALREEDLHVPAMAFFDLSTPDAPRDSLLVRIQDLETSFNRPLGTKEDLAEILFTSGSTETPKGVPIARQNLYAMVDEVIEKLHINSDDRLLEYRSYSWASAQLLSVMSTLVTGATLVLARKFSRSRFASWLKDYRITKSAGVPTVFNILVSDPIQLHRSDVPDLRFITSSSAPLSVDTLNRFEELYGVTINEMAGMTEAGWMMGNPPGKRKIGSVGTPFKYKRVSITREDGSVCDVDEEGEIRITGSSLAEGYLNSNGEIERFPEEGFVTGDIGYIDSEGYLFITGRKKELIIRGGVNISPAEISRKLLQHPAVREAWTIGVPDPTYGEEIASFIVTDPDIKIDKAHIVDFCSESLPDFKIPKKIYFLESLSKTPRGKVSRHLLLELARTLGDNPES